MVKGERSESRSDTSAASALEDRSGDQRIPIGVAEHPTTQEGTRSLRLSE